MKKFFIRKSLVTLTMLFSTLALIVVISNCSFAESKRPEKGSITFGAEKPPIIKSAPGIEDFKTIIADIAEKVVPTVVQVIPTKIDTIVFYNNPFYQFFGFPFNDFDEFFFGVPQDRGKREQPKFEKKEQRRQQGLGSGVIVSKDGYILTNYHVVSGADEIEVKTSEGRSFEAEIVGMDSLADVAVIKIKEKVNDLPVAYLGNSDKLRTGDWAIAIGNPFSLTSSVTLGIISALGRATGGDGNSYQNFIQTDAAINPGNSGGALVNINGELIGINTMIYSRTGGYMGIGFAIPINMAKRIMEDLIYEGKVSRGWLGVMIQDLDPATKEALKLDPKTKGVLIGDVFKNQPAEKAGIKRGDIVIAVDGKPVSNTNELRNEIASIKPGKKVPIKILREGKEQTVYVTLSSRDKANVDKSETDTKEEKPKDAEAISEKLGIKAGNITPELKQKYNISSTTKGVVIVEVTPGSIAQIEGLKEGDIIVEINRKPIENINDFKNVLKNIKNGESILFLIEREGNTFFKAFKLKK